MFQRCFTLVSLLKDYAVKFAAAFIHSYMKALHIYHEVGAINNLFAYWDHN